MFPYFAPPRAGSLFCPLDLDTLLDITTEFSTPVPVKDTKEGELVMASITKGDGSRWDSVVRAAKRNEKRLQSRIGLNPRLYSWEGYQTWLKKIAKIRKPEQSS